MKKQLLLSFLMLVGAFLYCTGSTTAALSEKVYDPVTVEVGQGYDAVSMDIATYSYTMKVSKLVTVSSPSTGVLVAVNEIYRTQTKKTDNSIRGSRICESIKTRGVHRRARDGVRIH